MTDPDPDRELWDRKLAAVIDAIADDVAVCEWCGEVIDQMDLSVEAFELHGGMICQACTNEAGDA